MILIVKDDILDGKGEGKQEGPDDTRELICYTKLGIKSSMF